MKFILIFSLFIGLPCLNGEKALSEEDIGNSLESAKSINDNRDINTAINPDHHETSVLERSIRDADRDSKEATEKGKKRRRTTKRNRNKNKGAANKKQKKRKHLKGKAKRKSGTVKKNGQRRRPSRRNGGKKTRKLSKGKRLQKKLSKRKRKGSKKGGQKKTSKKGGQNKPTKKGGQKQTKNTSKQAGTCTLEQFDTYKKYGNNYNQANRVAKIAKLMANRIDKVVNNEFALAIQAYVTATKDGTSCKGGAVPEDISGNLTLLQNCSTSVQALCTMPNVDLSKVESCKKQSDTDRGPLGTWTKSYEDCRNCSCFETMMGMTVTPADCTVAQAFKDINAQAVQTKNKCNSETEKGSWKQCRQAELLASSVVDRCLPTDCGGSTSNNNTTTTTATTPSGGGGNNTTTTPPSVKKSIAIEMVDTKQVVFEMA